MEEKAAISDVAMHIIRGCLVVPIQVELYDETIFRIQTAILERVNETGVKGMIIDLSGVGIIDAFLCQKIFNTVRMASMLGATTVLTGIKPEVVASLIDFDIEFKDILTARTLEEGFLVVEPIILPEEEEEEEEADEDYSTEEAED